MFGGLGLALPVRSAVGAAAPIYNPSVLSLTGWWRANYTTGTWTGTASAGSSGSRNLTASASPPTTGAALNSLTPADYDGTNQKHTNALALSNYVTASAWFLWILFKADTISTTAALPYSNDPLIMDTGTYFGMHLHNTGPKVQVYQWDGGVKMIETNFTLGAYTLLCARYDGTNLRCKVNSGSVSTLAAGNITTLTGTLAIGGNAQYTDGQIADLGIMNSAGSDALFDSIKEYINNRYALSL